MFRVSSLRPLYLRSFQSRFPAIQSCFYAAPSRLGDDPDELDEARKWFSKFDKSTIPVAMSKTRYSHSGGPGGQKVNKTASKATTVWPVESLEKLVPKVLIQELRKCTRYVSSTDSIQIQSDVHRGQNENREETHRRFVDEIKSLYEKRIPGVTSAEQKAKVQRLQKAENNQRLRIKKQQSDKKKSRKKGGESF